MKASHAAAVICVVLSAAGVRVCAGDEGGSESAIGWLRAALGDPGRADVVLVTLNATGDEDLVPLFVAASKSADKRKRLFAASALGQLGGPAAFAALREQLLNDSVMAIRAEALTHLLDNEAADADLLAAAIGMGDERVRCIAAGAVVHKNPNAAAAEVLERLSRSREASISGPARLSLLGMGRKEQLTAMGKMMGHAETPNSVVRMLLLLIAREKIAAAAPLAESVIGSKRPLHIRVVAARAATAVAPEASRIVFESIRNSPNMIYRVSLLRILAGRKDAGAYLAAIAKSKLPVGVLGRFEQARLGQPDAVDLTTRVQEAMRLGHPVVVNYILNRAIEDAESLGAKADFYTPAVLRYIASVDADAVRLGPQHRLAARLAAWLVDLGTPRAMAGIRKILTGRYSAVTRAAAAGVLGAKNKRACQLARGLLKSPYQELASDAALTLGHFGDPAAEEYFRRILSREGGYSINEMTVASWYLLKIHKRSKTAAEELAASVK